MKRLKQILSQSDTIVFIGSGISMWAGLPTWSGMIEELAKFVEFGGGNADLVRAEAKKGDLLQAASYGFDKLTKQQIGEFVREVCHYGKARPHEIHRKIVTLGPRCFITTNYDDLIEQSLRVWQPDRFYRPAVTNRQLTETAEIVHARALDFIFKPHGDASDSESIILTREQYRRLLPGGENQAALETVKMLLASRPVLYLGFGLRDPDFLYVRDLLANTYKGGVRDHYAIMADVHEQEIDYWRRVYGIHLVGYDTREMSDKSRDHSPLLTTLDSLLERPDEQKTSIFDPVSSDVLLALARHAAVLCRYPKQSPEFPIRVNPDGRRKKWLGGDENRFYYGSVETLLESGPKRLLLIGLPGAGKTYSLHRAAAKLAEELNDVCLSKGFVKDLVVVPIVVDLKLYRGDLYNLIAQSLPESLPFEELIRSYKVKIFVDSFNEMPREYLESGSYEADFIGFIGTIGKSSFVIGSRTTDGLSKLELPTFRLDYIEAEAVTAELALLGVSFEGRFSREIFRLIQRPFYFKFITSKEIDLSQVEHPKDFYGYLFDNVSRGFRKRFGFDLDIQQALAATAYAALDKGAEAFPITILISELCGSLHIEDEAFSLDIINWLVSESILIPYTKGRIAFIHQSVTEYLAATELARRYTSNPRALKDKLALRRWDQGLFLTLSFLSGIQAKEFFEDVVQADMGLAINASKYIELGRDDVVSDLLAALYESRRVEGKLGLGVEGAIGLGLQVSEVHEFVLRKFVELGENLGGIAVGLLASIPGVSMLSEVVELLYLNKHDYNFCLRATDNLAGAAVEETIRSVRYYADKVQAEITVKPNVDEELYGAFGMGVGVLLRGVELSEITKLLDMDGSESGANKYMQKLVCQILAEHDGPGAITVAGDLLLKGVDSAIETIARITLMSEHQAFAEFKSFNYSHALRLVELIATPWSSIGLKGLCLAQPSIASQIKEYALSKDGLLAALLLHCADPENMAPVLRELERISELTAEERHGLSFKLLEEIDIDWKGQETLFIKLLGLCDVNIANSILGGSYPINMKNLSVLDFGDIYRWLEWMRHEQEAHNDRWFLCRFGDLLGGHSTNEVKVFFLNEFNRGSEFRHLIFDYVLGRMDLSLDEIDGDGISFMLAELSRSRGESAFGGHLLGDIATESFIAEHLLPLLVGAQDPLRENLLQVLARAGARHGVRYLV